jgi:hypothetical protein
MISPAAQSDQMQASSIARIVSVGKPLSNAQRDRSRADRRLSGIVVSMMLLPRLFTL